MGGLTGIHYAAVSAYARDHGITGEAFALFHAFVTALDDEYVAFEADRAKAEAERRERGG